MYMHKSVAASVLALCLFSPCRAEDTWTTTDIILEASFQAVLLVDWRQTSDFHRQWTPQAEANASACGNQSFCEGNPLLGNYPTQAHINRWCIATGVGHLVISNYLSRKYRTTWQGVTLGLESVNIATNGIKGTVFVRF